VSDVGSVGRAPPPTVQPGQAGPGREKGGISVGPLMPNGSIYHQGWFLDAATDGRWGEARVIDGGSLLGRLPYALETCARFAVSRMPSLIRTLGPEIPALAGKSATVLRRRLEITHALIDQLPRVADFYQVFDPRITEAVAFMQRGFGISLGYAFWIERGRTEAQLLDAMTAEPRRHLRKAAGQFSIVPLDDVSEFCRFHDANLGGDNKNFHGSERMQRLLSEVVDHKAGMLLGARTAQDALVATIGILWDDVAVRNYVGSRQPGVSGASILLLWEAMRIACEKGLAFDFDGATSPGMFEFLWGMGGTLVTRLRIRRSTLAFKVARACAATVGMKHYFDGVVRSTTRLRNAQ
jgi:hypothetical protein